MASGGMNMIFGSPQFGSFINYGGVIIWIVIAILFFSVLAFIVLRLMRYKHPVLGFEVVGDAVQLFKDRAALIKDTENKKAFQFKLLKQKAILPPPPADAYVFDRRGKKAVMIGKISPTDFIYMRPSAELVKGEADLAPIKQDVLFWYVQLLKKTQEKYTKELKWYQNPVVISLATLAMCIVLIIVTFKYNATAAASMAQAGQAAGIAIVETAKSTVGQVV